MDTDAATKFTEEIMSMTAPTTNTLGGGMPGVGGGSVIFQGAISPANDVVVQLKENTAALMRTQTQSERQSYAKTVEGSLLTLATLSVIKQSQATKLIDDLHALVPSAVA